MGACRLNQVIVTQKLYPRLYNINNHFKWIIENKPNGHNDYKGMFNDKIKKRYIQFLQNIKQTDTILVTAKAS